MSVPATRLKPISVMIAALSAAPVWAQEGTRLPTVEVFGERVPSLTEPGLEAARERLDLIPGGANVVDAERYKRGRASTLQDTLGYSPGVFIQPRFGAEESRLSIRGSGIQRTFHLRGLLLLQDGVPLNQADGGGDFQAVEPLAARYIEVYRGANALAYGSTTLGGAINYVSPTGYDWPAFQARAEAGSFDYLHGQLSTAGVQDPYDYFASLTHFSQDGFRDHARQDNQRVFANLGRLINNALETRFYFTYVNTDSQLPGNLTQAELERDPRQANAANVSGDWRRDFDLYRLSNRTVYRIDDDQALEFGAFYAYKTLFHPIFQVLDIDSQDVGLSLRYTSTAPLLGHRNILTVGLVPAYTRQTDDRFVNAGGERGARTGESLQKASNLALYGEDQYYLTDQTALVVGAQATRSTRKFEDRFLTNGDNSFDTSYRRFSPKLGVRYELTPKAQVFANVSGSFEPPSFGELAGGPGITQVDAQRATTYEIGSRGLTELAPLDISLDWDIALYRATVKDELLSLNTPTGAPLGTVNASRTLHQGVELGLVMAVDHVEWQTAYLLNDFRFRDDASYADNDLPGIPRHFLKSALLFRTAGGYYAGPNLEWSPERYPVDMANTLFADDYTLIGLTLGRQVAQGFSWFIEARNLTDENYASATGVIADAQGADSAQFLPGDGRSYYAGLEWRW